MTICVVWSRAGKVVPGSRCRSHRGMVPIHWKWAGMLKTCLPVDFPPTQTIPGAVNPVAGAAVMRNGERHALSTTPAPVRRASSRKSLGWTPSGTRDTLGAQVTHPMEEKKTRHQENRKQQRNVRQENRHPQTGGCQPFRLGLCTWHGGQPTLRHVQH